MSIYQLEESRKDNKKVIRNLYAGWGNEDTKKLLEILKKHKVHVTFFMTGGWVESYPDDVKAIKEAGHDLATTARTIKTCRSCRIKKKHRN